MNARFQRVITRAQNYLEEVVSQNPETPSSVIFKLRHAEHLAAAGFGYSNVHEYLEAEKAGIERVEGYYMPDFAKIRSRMTAFRYPRAIVDKCCEVFMRAVSNDPDNAADASMHDDLQDGQSHDAGSPNHMRLMECLKYDVLRDKSVLWKTLAKFAIENNGETEENLKLSIELPPDFPSPRYFAKVVDAPFSVVFDLNQGEDPEALFYRTNRQLGLRGNLRLKSSGKRGWAYPTIRLDETPFVDHRTPAEQRGEYLIHQGPDIDEDDFERGTKTGRAGGQPPSQASRSFLAGWVLNADGTNGTGHMSSGQIDRAFHGAWANAMSLSMLDKRDALELAAEACRYLASNRIRRALEELIQENTADDEGW